MKNGTATKTRRRMTVETYIASEERAEVRHEYVDGQLIPMPGTTTYHNVICGNIYIVLRSLLKNTFCKVFMENVKVQIASKKDYTYPDVLVTCDERDFDKRYIIEHPSVIFEVSSPSTKVYDKTDKFIRFRKIASLEHYVVVNSEKVDIEVYTRVGNEWTSESFTNIIETLELTALKINLPIEAIYAETFQGN
ncbi:MAG: Uma2 family endonuclease [Saprospiraceae bacterium]|nr:Uma2 family endonuclease [Saprospiraceae bacterium]